jgi:hypothetical protein
MYFERLHSFYRHHPHRAPILMALLVVFVIAIVFSLLRSDRR